MGSLEGKLGDAAGLITAMPELSGAIEEFSGCGAAPPLGPSTLYVEFENRGYLIAAWESGELNATRVDYEDGNDPIESYRGEVNAAVLDEEVGKLIAWVTRRG